MLAETRLKALLATCTGRTFIARRDSAIIRLFLDGGPRLTELAGLKVEELDLRE